MSDARTQDIMKELRQAADAAAANARNNFLAFLLAGVYIAIMIGSTTDAQLLRGSGITLPVLNVALPILGVFLIVPPLFVLLHFNLLLQLTFLSRSLHRLDREIQSLRSTADQDRARDMIFPFTFSHLIVGRHHGAALRMVVRLMVWITLMILPVLLLLWAQVRFLPYHSEAVTWGAHRLSIVGDLALLWFFWPRLFDPEGKWRPWRRKRSARLPAAILWVLAGGLSSLAVFWLSFLVLVVPGEILEMAAMRPVITQVFGHNGYGSKVGGGKWYEAWFHRNLVLPEKTLVMEAPAPEIVAAYLRQGMTAEQAFHDFGKGLDLRDRDLRFAILSRANLAKANLRFTLLQGAILQGTNLQGADLAYAGLQDANLNSAKLQGAVLWEAKLSGATLQFAMVHGAHLGSAELQGAFLNSAIFRGANLDFADLRGANLSYAELQGARLNGASLSGADLSSAKLEGAYMVGALLQGADLTSASLGGADLIVTDFHLADLRGANFEYLLNEEWELFMVEIAREVPSQSANRANYPRPREDATSLLKEAVKREKTNLPHHGAGWQVLYDPAPESRPDAQLWPFADWPPPSLDKNAKQAFLEALVPFLVKLACEDRYVAHGITLRVRGMLPRHQLGAAMLARALLDQADDTETCPGIAALPSDDLVDLKKWAAK